MGDLVRFPPPPSWPEELDEHERTFQEQGWEGGPPVAGYDPIGAEFYNALCARVEDDSPEACARMRRAALALSQTASANLPPAEPHWHSWLIMLLVPIAALCGVGIVIAVVG